MSADQVTGAWQGESAYGDRNFMKEARARFRNTYDCPACGCHWRDESTTTCDDCCPDGNLSCSPSDSEDVETE